MFIYLIVNHVTGKYYVGKTKEISLKRYWQKQKSRILNQTGETSKPHLYNSVRKYGWDKFTIHALRSDFISEEECLAREKDFISFLRARDPEYGYNICAGGRGTIGWKPSAETRARQSASNKGKHRERLASPEMQAARLAAWQRVLDEKNGSFQTTESIDKIKVARAKQDESVRLVAFRKAEEAHGEEWTKRRVATRRRTGSFGKMSESGRKSQISAVVAANHLRWHVNRGTTNLTCVLCIRG